MRIQYDLGALDWTLAGWTPHVWRQQRSIESGVAQKAEVPAIPARVPGSVQRALLDAGLLPDWNLGLNARLCEWVENRHWIYTARLPDSWLVPGCTVRLRALGLDYRGWLLVNGREIAAYAGSFLPHAFDLTNHLREQNNALQIVFDCPPRWLGQIGYTSQVREWKPRYNYFWDWTSRLVQIGVWDQLLLEVTDGQEILNLRCRARWDPVREIAGLYLSGAASAEPGSRITVGLEREGEGVLHGEISVEQLAAGARWEDLSVALWWPNGQGEQPLYTLRCRLLDSSGAIADEAVRRVGFRSVAWEACEGAPRDADPWVCCVNGRPVFLQGVNWTPILPNFADVSDGQYRSLLHTYRDLGCTMLRVWGGAFLEKQIFYDLCDELGLLVWQEFPLSSSGLDNLPPDDITSIEELAAIAESYVTRRGHHASLSLWCGGNELQDASGKPLDLGHPTLARLAKTVAHHDGERRFLPTSPSGPSFSAQEERFGRGLHWDVHGPWNVHGSPGGDWTRYWEHDDALFHSEIGCPAASPVDLIRQYKGELPEVPGTVDNPLWRRTGWWIEWHVFVEEQGREPHDLEEYVAWSQERQRQALSLAARAAKRRFPRCGGFLLWMGHDSFPCTANTSIVDFHGRPKPAALAIAEVFREGR